MHDLPLPLLSHLGVRANAQQDRIFVGMILILIFGEALGLYGLIVALILSQGWTSCKGAPHPPLHIKRIKLTVSSHQERCAKRNSTFTQQISLSTLNQHVFEKKLTLEREVSLAMQKVWPSNWIIVLNSGWFVFLYVNYCNLYSPKNYWKSKGDHVSLQSFLKLGCTSRYFFFAMSRFSYWLNVFTAFISP